MRAVYLNPVATPATPLEVSRAYFAALRELIKGEPKPEAVAVLHAQCALETGNMAACRNFSVGNIKASANYDGYFTCYRCNELLPQSDGSKVYKWFSPTGAEEPKGTIVPPLYTLPPGQPQTRFRAFKTLADGVFDKIDFLAQPRWRPALDIALAGDAMFYVAKVRQLGYFTAELAPYQRAVVSLASKLLPIARGVAAELPVPLEEDEQLCADMAECMQVELPDWLRARVEMFNKLGPSLDDYWATRKLEHDSTPTMPQVRLPESEPPKGEI